jgi:hypothetical protein
MVGKPRGFCTRIQCRSFWHNSRSLLAGTGRRYFGPRLALALAILIFGAGTLSIAWVGGLGTLIALRFARLGAATGPLLIGMALRMGMMPSRLFYFAAFAAAIAGLCFFVLGKARQIAA